jgi:hypothetical protein
MKAMQVSAVLSAVRRRFFDELVGDEKTQEQTKKLFRLS